MKLAIVGAGLTGLSAAYELSEYFNLKIFEKENIGGLASSYCPSYCIEKFYHHCFRRDEELLNLIKRLGLGNKLVWRVVRIGQEFEGKIYPMNTLYEIIRYPGMKLLDKIKLAFFTLKCRKMKYSDFKKYDELSVLDGIKEDLGEDLLNSFFLPLLRSKFGNQYDEVSYSWLLARVAIRSNRKRNGEELGYLRHGFQQLFDRLVAKVETGNVEIVKQGVYKVENCGKWKVNGEEFDAVLWTAPVPLLSDINRELKSKSGIKDIKYQSSVCVLLSSDETVTEDIYWSNVNCTFGAVVEHTHFMPFEDYGENLIYLAGYTHPESKLMKCCEKDVIKMYLRDLRKFGMEEKEVRWAKLFRAKYSGPVYESGYLNKITPYRTKIKGFYVAGITSKPNYPERSMNGSVKAGMEVAEVIKKDFGF
jgi:protoporphyrinogen oxidase